MVVQGFRTGRTTSPERDRHMLSTTSKIPQRGSSGHRHSIHRSLVEHHSKSPVRYRATAVAAASPTRTRFSYHRSSGSREQRPEQREPAAPAERYEVHPEEEAYGETVCDYDTSATVLYELLESSTWEQARSRCRSHPEEVRTWIVRKDKSLHVRWKLLPLHAAIIFQAPNFLVSTLLDKYPAATSRKDDQGMLPLHLAFRHKQEDEDLLHMLLKHCPQAITVKDRRDRVPLEHGRDAKFSARFMRMYADAAVAASRVNGGGGLEIDPSFSFSRDHQLSLEKRAALRMEYEKKIQKLKAETEETISSIKSDYEKQLKRQRESHNRTLAATQDKNHATFRELKLTMDEEKQALIVQHNEEVNELRDLLTDQVNKDKELAESLQKEIHHLQLTVQEKRDAIDVAVTEHSRLHAYNDELKELLRAVSKQHGHLLDLMAQQQDDLEASRLARNRLVQTLLRQEDGDGEKDLAQGRNMMDFVDKVRRKIDQTISDRGDVSDGRPTNRRSHQRHTERDRVESLDRVERSVDRVDTRAASHHRERQGSGYLVKMDRMSGQRGKLMEELERERVEREQEFGEALSDKPPQAYAGTAGTRTLTDGISAITEYSDFE